MTEIMEDDEYDRIRFQETEKVIPLVPNLFEIDDLDNLMYDLDNLIYSEKHGLRLVDPPGTFPKLESYIKF